MTALDREDWLACAVVLLAVVCALAGLLGLRWAWKGSEAA